MHVLLEEVSEAGSLVVSLREKRLDAVIAASFREAMVARIDQGQRNIVLDMSHVIFMDSSGLGAVVYVLKHLGHGGRLHICGVTPGVMAVLKLTRMDRVLKTFETRQAAVAA
jgi:anti-sigma B factor antagonist